MLIINSGNIAMFHEHTSLSGLQGERSSEVRATSIKREAFNSGHTPSEVVSRTEMQEGGQRGITSCTCSMCTNKLN